MLQIPCPYCGVRDEEEFRCGGELHIVRPGLESMDAVWSDYLFNRVNARGVREERWLHTYGCGRWIGLVRDTATHEIQASFLLDEPIPAPQGAP
jgi:sarcosine oxidase subunit delta